MPQNCQSHKKQGKSEKLSQTRRVWIHEQMECDILDWILEENKDISGKTGEYK